MSRCLPDKKHACIILADISTVPIKPERSVGKCDSIQSPTALNYNLPQYSFHGVKRVRTDGNKRILKNRGGRMCWQGMLSELSLAEAGVDCDINQ